MVGIVAGALAGAGKAVEDIADNQTKLWNEQEMTRMRSDIEMQKQKALLDYQEAKAIAGDERKATMQAQRDAAILGPALGYSPTSVNGGIAKAESTAGAPVQGLGAAPAKVTSAINMSGGLKALAEKFNVPEEALRFDLARNEGKGIAKMLEEGAKPDIVIQNGVALDKKKVKPGIVPSLQNSADGKTTFTEADENGRPVVSVPKGAPEAFGTFRGIEASVKAANTPMKVYNPDKKREEFVSEAEALGAGRGQPGTAAPASPTQVPPTVQAGRDAEALQIIEAELQDFRGKLDRARNGGDATQVSKLQETVSGLEREVQRTRARSGAAPASAAPAAGGGAMAAGPSASEDLSKKATEDLNSSFVKELEQVKTQGGAAGELLATVQATRAALKALGGTGWGTEAKAQAASILTGLGIAPDRVKAYSKNAEIFRNTMMQRLQVVLNAAKGPQTNDDARRASETYATLGNTPKANEFILDMTEANAQREVMKAKFYSRALPQAQQAGDLMAVERNWEQMAPSVFSMPSMQKWVKR